MGGLASDAVPPLQSWHCLHSCLPACLSLGASLLEPLQAGGVCLLEDLLPTLGSLSLGTPEASCLALPLRLCSGSIHSEAHGHPSVLQLRSSGPHLDALGPVSPAPVQVLLSRPQAHSALVCRWWPAALMLGCLEEWQAAWEGSDTGPPQCGRAGELLAVSRSVWKVPSHLIFIMVKRWDLDPRTHSTLLAAQESPGVQDLVSLSRSAGSCAHTRHQALNENR